MHDVDVPSVRTSLQTLSSQKLQTIEITRQNRETCANIYQSKAKNERNTLRITEVRENTSGGRKDRKTTRKTSLSIWKSNCSSTKIIYIYIYIDVKLHLHKRYTVISDLTSIKSSWAADISCSWAAEKTSSENKK